MRFESWDVLLFPDGSRVPVQEFKTQCFVTRDTTSPYAPSRTALNPAALHLPSGSQGFLGQTPVLTAFVPTLPRNSSFRVSIHSWEMPQPTRLMESLMQPDDSVLYEARVFIDGQCVSGSLITQRTSWPHIIEMDKSGNPDSLRFPVFHEELLQDSHWEASEAYGRIRIVIAEGFARPHRSPPFERVKDIIIFSFQHAPLYVLEYAHIAWPNPGMWQQAQRESLKYNFGANHASRKEDEDSHSHSPTRHGGRTGGAPDHHQPPLYPTWPYRHYPTPPVGWQNHPWPERDSRLPTLPIIPDPFVEPYKEVGPTRRQRSTLEDVPMPDYVGSSSDSSRAISSMTGISFGHSKQPSIIAPCDDEQYNQLIEALSPKKYTSGTYAPTNTPASAAPSVPKPSAAAEARAISRPRNPSRPGVLKGIPHQVTGVSPASSDTSQSFDDDFGKGALLPTSLLSPSPRVKSKKEGNVTKGSRRGSNRSNSANNYGSPLHDSDKQSMKDYARSGGSAVASSESKRKRSGAPTRLDVKSLEGKDVDTPSPTKKMSRLDKQGICSQDHIGELLRTDDTVGVIE
ncbi:hypothetical protein AJ80_05018 [Polytolypa hystricis UAMH7299]|uniref:Uncharacterized protein n=1 Tax=Polytolypa hystricis (strain UAMH7299) TaxID=1447883 RepID=A0A2B7Y6X2_POLH7|nr:hypothetical protein AJ80_05018 [Polytolypa hystricis UAMH7299]